jgi:predicted ester cyclase
MDKQGFLALLAPEFVGRGSMAPQGVDGETIWRVMVAFRETFPDIQWELGRWMVSDGPIVVCQLFESGTFSGPWANRTRPIAPTNRSYISDAVMYFRFDDAGRIVENQSWYDSVDWFHQIGVDPDVASPPGGEPDSASV